MSDLIFFIWILSLPRFSFSTCPHLFDHHTDHKFMQKTDRFWEFHVEKSIWIEVKLPYDLVSCVNGNCTKVGSIQKRTKLQEKQVADDKENQEHAAKKENSYSDLRKRRRMSVTKMTAASVWVTGESGSIYERFWNGAQWVIAPHHLPESAGPAISVFIVNQTILALSEAGTLHQMQFGENSQPNWVEFMPIYNQSTKRETKSSLSTKIKSGVVSHDVRRAYFCTKSGKLLELVEVEPPRWINHGRPPGADVAAVADVANIKDVIFTISSTGVLYEYQRNSKPPWKKHLWKEDNATDTSLVPLLGCTIHGLIGDHSISLFLLTKGGNLVERRLHQRKWKWIIHSHPGNHHLTSITQVLQDEHNDLSSGLFLTTSTGLIFQFQMLKHGGRNNNDGDVWINHMHPENAKVARGISGLPFQVGRTIFPVDDGRLAELHLQGQGGEHLGPIETSNNRRKPLKKYIWSLLDAPDSEGWNAGYCNEERGPMNCMMGIKDESRNLGIVRATVSRKRKGAQAQEHYIPCGFSEVEKQTESSKTLLPWDKDTNTQYRLRLANEGRSFFLVTSRGLTFEYLNAENVWFWMKHDHSTPIKGVLGNYDGGLYMVDIYGALLIRERCGDELVWTNGTAFKKGRRVIGGPPWDVRTMKVTSEDALFFVGKSGKLLQLTVALRKFKWKDCKHPPDAKVVAIADQELFRKNIVFVIGSDGRLYQYNKVTELWHEHYKSHHLVLSQLPGTAIRPNVNSLTGSLFMLSEDGGLIEYHWSPWDGWDWVEHGTPSKSVTIVGPPGPWFEGNELLLIGSDGNVYVRYMDDDAMTWRWKKCRFPYAIEPDAETQKQEEGNVREDICADISFSENSQKDGEDISGHDKYCNPKVGPTRPIMLSENAAIFELQDGRLAEMQRMEDKRWVWSRIIGTPTSLCNKDYWIAFESES